jgi:Cu(I)/Ag(I) efflux system membrane fusion protein/cobalt-zinc-cadmium efflux system membrane fusion protein
VRGRNRAIVTLRDSKGAPISGAQVTVTFYMAAMPAMGMTAMRAQGTADDQAMAYTPPTSNCRAVARGA